MLQENSGNFPLLVVAHLESLTSPSSTHVEPDNSCHCFKTDTPKIFEVVANG
jgi:hypothetical protein